MTRTLVLGRGSFVCIGIPLCRVFFFLICSVAGRMMNGMRFRMQTGRRAVFWMLIALLWIFTRGTALPDHLARHRRFDITLDITVIVLYSLVGFAWVMLYFRGRIELLPLELRYRYVFRWKPVPYSAIRAVKPSPHGSSRMGSGAVVLEMDSLSGSFPRRKKTLAVVDEADFIDELQRLAPHIVLERTRSALSFTT